MVGLLVGCIVGCHHQACLLVGQLHHWYGTGAGSILFDKVHHGLAGLIHLDGHVRLLAVGATGQRHPAKLRRWGCLLPDCALSWEVGNGPTLVGELLLLGATVGCSASAYQGQDCFMHARR
jgi:hypothetical protein